MRGMPVAEVAALDKHLSQGQANNASPRVAAKSRRDSQDGNFALQEHQPERDTESLCELALWCEQFSPIVGLEQCELTVGSASPSCLLLDITGLVPIFGSESQLDELIHQAFEQRGYQIRTGVGNTVAAAWALAHFGKGDCGDSEADSVPATEAEVELLPVEALRLPAETIETLHQLGIETIEQLMQLPRDALATRLGEMLILRMDQVFGRKAEVIVAHRPPPQFEADWILEHPTDRRDAIDTILSELIDKVTDTLAENNHAAVQVQAELKGQKAVRTLTVSLFQPSSNPKHIYDLFQLQLEASQMREPIRCVRLFASTTVRLTGEQHFLWNEVGHNRDHDVAQLVDRLSSRLGKECVFGIQAQAGALPEKAYRKKLLSDSIRNKPRRTVTANSLKARHRPLWLHEPEPLRIEFSTATCYATRMPSVFQFQNCQHRIVRHWGPERIETGWWKGPSVRRDYYRVETEAGYRFWLFRKLDGGGWFLHGCFE